MIVSFPDVSKIRIPLKALEIKLEVLDSYRFATVQMAIRRVVPSAGKNKEMGSIAGRAEK